MPAGYDTASLSELSWVETHSVGSTDSLEGANDASWRGREVATPLPARGVQSHIVALLPSVGEPSAMAMVVVVGVSVVAAVIL